jgi:hypothetical protein
MASAKKPTETNIQPLREYNSIDAREDQLIDMAYQLASQRICDGTASDGLLGSLMRYGTRRERIELEILEKQKEYISAKTEALNTAKEIEKLYADALAAMNTYRGSDSNDIDE